VALKCMFGHFCFFHAGQGGQAIPGGPGRQRAAEEEQKRGPEGHRGTLHQPVPHDSGVFTLHVSTLVLKRMCLCCTCLRWC